MIRILTHNEATAFAPDRSTDDSRYEAVVRPILAAVRKDGDAALLAYARQFDNLGDAPLLIPASELSEAAASLTPAVRTAIDTAIANIRQFAEAQLPRERFEEFSPGRKLGLDRSPV